MNNEIQLAQKLLNRCGVSVLDAARLVLDIVDLKNEIGLKTSTFVFCKKIVERGKRNYRNGIREMTIEKGLETYLESKSHLRKDSLLDIKALGRRLIKDSPNFAARNFSDFSLCDCEKWLDRTFKTSSQFNKGRTMLHGFFEFALRREWCDKNPVKFVPRRKVREEEIVPLPVEETQRLIKTAQKPRYHDCAAAVALLALAGIRPREVQRLKWNDIDLRERTIVVRSRCSKIGGVRQVEICPALKRILQNNRQSPDTYICPNGWRKRWKNIRDESGFKGVWIHDVLRHTYASFHAKFYRDLSRLQLNMGHLDLSLLRARYINMNGISMSDARRFFTKN